MSLLLYILFIGTYLGVLYICVEFEFWDRLTHKLNKHLPPDKITGPVLGFILAPVETVKSALPQKPPVLPQHGRVSLPDVEAGALSLSDH